MKIELKYPYSADWKAGYIVVNRENRRTLLLVGDGKRSSTAYARYLLAVHLGRYLLNEETVDHIDNDKTNDTIGNLQILSRSANALKSSNKKQVTEHGTLSMYRYCKCDSCRKNKSEYSKRKRIEKLNNLL